MLTMKKKNNKFDCYITIDYEEWYHIEYLKQYKVQQNNITCCDKIDDFIIRLGKENIPTTFFVVSDICENNIKTLKLVLNYKNKIGCHTSNHENLKNLSTQEFKEQVYYAKSIIEKLLNITVDSFRAPSFSANVEKIKALSDIGFLIDSSYIDSGANEYYEKNDLSDFRSKEIGFIFQLHNLIPNLSVLENVMIPMYGNGYNSKQMSVRAMNLLKYVNLQDKATRKPTELSGGERQRVAIARALANKPSIVLADEPTGSLDSKNGKMILKRLKELHEKENVTLIMVTHDLNVASMAERTIKVLDGKIQT